MKNIYLFLISVVLLFAGAFFAKEISSVKSFEIVAGLSETDKKTAKNVEESIDLQLKEKIGQMILLGFRGAEAEVDSEIVKIIKDLDIGGVVLFDYDVPSKSFPRNIKNTNQVKKLITDLQAYSKTPLFVSVDAEGGNVNRLKQEYGFLKIPSAEKMGLEGTAGVSKWSEKLAKQLNELGFNLNFAPVIDVNINYNNPIIGKIERSFSFDEKKVAELSSAFIREHQEAGVIAVAKHFPGHGSSATDSHLGIVDVTQTYQDKELQPYKDLQNQGVLEVVMTAHIINKKIDEKYPATLSAKFIEEILRNKVGFDGVVVSDDMQMGAVANNYGFEDSIIRAVNAGCDIILLSNNGQQKYDGQIPYQAIDIIYKAVKNNKISEQRIEDSFERILNLKRKYKIIN